MLEWDFAHVGDDVKEHNLHMLQGTFLSIYQHL